MSAYTKNREVRPLGIGVVSISDSRVSDNHKSGNTLIARLERDGHQLTGRHIVKDNIDAIRTTIRQLAARGDTDAVITTGGTGLTGFDVTIEALRPIFDKEIDGFGVAFHMVSWQKIGTSTIQSRATAGIIDGCYVFCLPGSPGACKDGWDEILSAQLDYRRMPCNFVEIMPRLDEHLRRAKG